MASLDTAGLTRLWSKIKSFVNDKLGSTTMGTTATTVTGAIAEHEGDITSLSSQIASLVQESAFSITVENGEHVLYWYGAAGECPYTVALENGVYVLYYNYTTV